MIYSFDLLLREAKIEEGKEDEDEWDKDECWVENKEDCFLSLSFFPAAFAHPSTRSILHSNSALKSSIKYQTNRTSKMTTLANKRPEYVVEHMEEDDPDAPAVFPKWALLE